MGWIGVSERLENGFGGGALKKKQIICVGDFFFVTLQAKLWMI